VVASTALVHGPFGRECIAPIASRLCGECHSLPILLNTPRGGDLHTGQALLNPAPLTFCGDLGPHERHRLAIVANTMAAAATGTQRGLDSSFGRSSAMRVLGWKTGARGKNAMM
jgi:hypothetical protein